MASKYISIARAKTIFQRQKETSWDEHYIPGILATVKEAPSISHAFILRPKKLGGREVHLLSTPERNAALLGLYHPEVVGLQEQRMLNPNTAVHPLWSHPEAARNQLKQLTGTIQVADHLEMLDEFPIVWDSVLGQSKRVPIVYPWCGDLLWAIKKNDRPLNCINWNIKDQLSAFKRPISHEKKESPIRLLARYEIEESYYASASIRTISVSEDQIDRNVSANLRQLFIHHDETLLLSNDSRSDVVERYQSALGLGIPPNDVIDYYAERGIHSIHEAKTVFYQAIWNRDLRVDLFKPILINRPLHAEVRDVLDVYKDWFECESCT
ncbi:hypothetical protein [Herbaspirillum huttiense]|uniref:hypothetical protein n=1 Tax=Herbaspirillum huttiense TaxID=863372 RepID=UPI003CE98C9D